MRDAGAVGAAAGRDESTPPDSRVDLGVDIGAVHLENPIMLASGTVGYGDEFSELIDLSAIGGIVVKGLSLQPVPGNAPPRIVETRGGMLNSIGLQNIGVEAFVRDKMPHLRQHDTVVVANIWGTTVNEYVGVAQRLNGTEGLAALELNVSCPNIKEGGVSFGNDPRQLRAVTEAVRKVTGMPLWVKLAPGVTDIGLCARAAEDGGADALSVMNTIRGMTVSVEQRKSLLTTVYGGFSGPVIFPLALYLLYEVTLATSLPLIGIGGIDELDQVLQFLIVGAGAVQIGTANFYDPGISQRLVDELESWCRDEGLDAVRELVGTLQVPE